MSSVGNEEEFKKRLLQTFKIEAQGHIKSIIEGLLEIEKLGYDLDHSQILERLFRNAHSLKGSSRAVNLLSIEEVCQQIEGLFDLIKKREVTFDEEMIETLLKACSFIETLINNPNSHIPSKEIADKIRSFRDKKNTSKVKDTKEVFKKQATYEDLTLASNNRDILRLENSKFEVLLRETEEIVSIKGFLHNNLNTLNDLDERVINLLSNTKKVLSKDPDNMIQSVQSLRDDLKEISKQIRQHKKSFIQRGYFLERKVDGILFHLKDIVMMPISSLLDSFPMMIRELSRSQNKDVEFVVEGKELTVDRRILDELRDPIIHILRNSIDHGIEPTQERLSLQKRPKGTIRFQAFIERSGEIVLNIADDGRGIDIDALKEKAINKGLVSPDELSQMKEDEVINLIFKPHMSTAKIVTNISGRGLGMTIVREGIERLGGSVRVISERSKGTAFIIRLPVNVSTLKVIIIRAFNNQLFGLPTRNIAYSSRVVSSGMKTIEGIDTVDINGRLVSMIKLDDALDMVSANTEKQDYINYFVISSDNKSVAFSTKEILNEEEVFLKSFHGHIKKMKNFIGAVTISSGETILVLNPTDLVKSAIKKGFVPTFRPDDVLMTVKKKAILIAEDSITARTLFKGILESAGYEVKTAVDGLEAWSLLKGHDFDLLVSDVQMPGLSGFDLTEKIRNDRKLFRLPVVLITGLESPQDKQRGIEVGANAYIVKSSFDQSNLLEVIRRLI